MGKRVIKFRTKVLSTSDKEQIYAFFDKRKQHKEKAVITTILGGVFGELHFWR